MDIACNNCKSKFRIPDDKIPSEKTLSLNCPKCKNKISINDNPNILMPDLKNNSEDLNNAADSNAYDASEKPFDFLEEEGLTALICESDPSFKKIWIEALDVMEYHSTVAENNRDALTKMRYHTYDLIVVNETFDTSNPDENSILVYLERLPMAVRRNIFVALTTNRFRTMDNMAAFNKSVNITINNNNIKNVKKILARGILDNDLFFRVYKETLKKTGRS